MHTENQTRQSEPVQNDNRKDKAREENAEKDPTGIEQQVRDAKNKSVEPTLPKPSKSQEGDEGIDDKPVDQAEDIPSDENGNNNDNDRKDASRNEGWKTGTTRIDANNPSNPAKDPVKP